MSPNTSCTWTFPTSRVMVSRSEVNERKTTGDKIFKWNGGVKMKYSIYLLQLLCSNWSTNQSCLFLSCSPFWSVGSCGYSESSAITVKLHDSPTDTIQTLYIISTVLVVRKFMKFVFLKETLLRVIRNCRLFWIKKLLKVYQIWHLTSSESGYSGLTTMRIVKMDPVDPDNPNLIISSVRIRTASHKGNFRAIPGPIIGKATDLRPCCLHMSKTRASPVRSACMGDSICIMHGLNRGHPSKYTKQWVSVSSVPFAWLKM